MSIARALPYLLLALVLAAAGYLAGAVTDPFAPAQTSVRGELSPQEPRLRRELEQARGEAAELTGELQRAQSTIDRLHADLARTRARIAELQRRAENAEAARAAAQSRIGELAERVAALKARADAGATAETRNDTGDAATADAGRPASTAGPTAASPDTAPSREDAAPSPEPDVAGDDAPAPDTATSIAAGEASANDDSAAAEGGAAESATTESATTQSATEDRATEDGATEDGATEDGATEDGSARNAGPSDVELDARPGSGALSAIDPTTRQANRLVSGVQAYQDAQYQAAYRAWLPLAQAGYARAQLHLGALFLEGRGTERNDPLAYTWLTIAQNNGSQNAGSLLDQLRARMTDADMDAARQLLTRARTAAGNAG